MSNSIYRHYGDTHFYREMVLPISNEPAFTKPYGGFWGVGREQRWKEFVAYELMRPEDVDKYFQFTLNDANIYTIRKLSDVTALPIVSKHPTIAAAGYYYCIDFELLLRSGIDAIELIMDDDFHNLYYGLYMWDVDSILVLNPDKIEEVST